MNMDSKVIKVLCFGDSNTWGEDPNEGAPRYDVDIRWTGKLQEMLGEDYEIIEEGLCGRTTVLDDPKESGRNGKTYLIPCLLTHSPIDIVILMLGTNDLKERFNLRVEEIAENVGELVSIIKSSGQNKEGASPEIILLCPPYVNEHATVPMEGMKGAEEKSRQLGAHYQKIAEKYNCQFIDIASYVQPSLVDGCHLDPEAHAEIARLLFEKLKSRTS